MRTFFFTAALGALAAALPQEINLDAVIAAPDPTYTMAVGVTAQVVTLSTSAVIASATSVTSMTVATVPAAETGAAQRLAKKDAVSCAVQPAGATGAPTYSPSAASDFAAASTFGAVASAAATPSGYSQTFVNLAASNNAYGYMGFTTLQDYDTQKCATQCDGMAGCMAVNIYYERDPSVDPGSDCPDPTPVTMIKCVFWGGPVSADNALNVGQYRTNFHVLIAGSNGYVNKTLTTPAGYTGPGVLGNSAINAPYDSQGYNTYMGFKIFTAGGFNVQYCADYCTAQNKYNAAYPPNDGSPVQLCQFFNTYILYKNTYDQVQGQYCAIYSEPWDNSYATNNGQYRGSDFYGIYDSYTFTNTTGIVAPNKNGAVHQASKDITYSSLQTYCSTLLGYQTPLASATVTQTVSTTATATIYATTTVTSGAASKRQAAAASTPDVLTKYPASVRSSACSLVVASPTAAAATTTTVTATAQATVSAVSTVTVSSSKGNTPVTCAGFPAIYTANNGEQFGHECNIEYGTPAASIILPATQPDFGHCVDLCSVHKDCKYLDYYNPNGNCILLTDNTGGQSHTPSGYDSAYLIPPSSASTSSTSTTTSAKGSTKSSS